MPQYTKDDISQALIDVANGNGVRAAAQDWGVPYTTLREQIKGRENHWILAENQQGLSKAQEDHLAN